jgi:hypothetical protein
MTRRRRDRVNDPELDDLVARVAHVFGTAASAAAGDRAHVRAMFAYDGDPEVWRAFYTAAFKDELLRFFLDRANHRDREGLTHPKRVARGPGGP